MPKELTKTVYRLTVRTQEGLLDYTHDFPTKEAAEASESGARARGMATLLEGVVVPAYEYAVVVYPPVRYGKPSVVYYPTKEDAFANIREARENGCRAEVRRVRNSELPSEEVVEKLLRMAAEVIAKDPDFSDVGPAFPDPIVEEGFVPMTEVEIRTLQRFIEECESWGHVRADIDKDVAKAAFDVMQKHHFISKAAVFHFFWNRVPASHGGRQPHTDLYIRAQKVVKIYTADRRMFLGSELYRDLHAAFAETVEENEAACRKLGKLLPATSDPDNMTLSDIVAALGEAHTETRRVIRNLYAEVQRAAGRVL